MSNWYKEYNEKCDQFSELCKILGRLEGSLKMLQYETDDPKIKQFIQDKLSQTDKEFDNLFKTNTHKGE